MKASELVAKIQEMITKYGDRDISGEWFEDHPEIVFYELQDVGFFEISETR